MTDSWRAAVTATRHCLTGCALGEIAGMVLGTWWGWGTARSPPVNHWLMERGRARAIVHRLHERHAHDR